MKQLSSHEFALYYPELTQTKEGDELLIQNKELLHRMHRVLRLKQEDYCVLFNRVFHVLAQLKQVDRQGSMVHINAYHKNRHYKPEIIFLLPLLKRDALAHAIYFLVEVGVNEIRLIETEKTHRGSVTSHEYERLERICIAAAEQSKHFAFPKVNAAVPFDTLVTELPRGRRLYGNPEGKPITDCDLSLDEGVPFILTCGPEGDFAAYEKKKLEAASFEAVHLTPTILRAETAALCLSSLCRSLFSSE